MYRWERNRAAEGKIFIYSTSSRHSRKQQRMPRVSSSLGQRMGCLGQGRVCCAGAGGGRRSKGARPSHRPPSTTSGDTGAAPPGAASPGAASLTCCPPCLASPGQQHRREPLRSLLHREGPCGSSARGRRRQPPGERKAGMFDIKALTQLTVPAEIAGTASCLLTAPCAQIPLRSLRSGASSTSCSGKV